MKYNDTLVPLHATTYPPTLAGGVTDDSIMSDSLYIVLSLVPG